MILEMILFFCCLVLAIKYDRASMISSQLLMVAIPPPKGVQIPGYQQRW